MAHDWGPIYSSEQVIWYCSKCGHFSSRSKSAKYLGIGAPEPDEKVHINSQLWVTCDEALAASVMES